MSEPTAGNPSEPKPLYCGNCGALIPDSKHFCPNCLAPASLGVSEPPVVPAKQPFVPAEVPPPPATPPAGSPAASDEYYKRVCPGCGAPITGEGEILQCPFCNTVLERDAASPTGPVPPVTPPAGPGPAETPPVSGPPPVVPVGPNLVSPVVPEGRPVTPPPASGSGEHVVTTPPVPPRQPVRWPWILLAVGAGLASLILLFVGCILLLAAESPSTEGLTPSETRTVALLCCLLPGLILVAGAVLGGVRAARAK